MLKSISSEVNTSHCWWAQYNILNELIEMYIVHSIFWKNIKTQFSLQSAILNTVVEMCDVTKYKQHMRF